MARKVATRLKTPWREISPHLLGRHPAVDERELHIAAKQGLALVRQPALDRLRKRADGGNGG